VIRAVVASPATISKTYLWKSKEGCPLANDSALPKGWKSLSSCVVSLWLVISHCVLCPEKEYQNDSLPIAANKYNEAPTENTQWELIYLTKSNT
jgi:hypothetical protein